MATKRSNECGGGSLDLLERECLSDLNVSPERAKVLLEKIALARVFRDASVVNALKRQTLLEIDLHESQIQFQKQVCTEELRLKEDEARLARLHQQQEIYLAMNTLNTIDDYRRYEESERRKELEHKARIADMKRQRVLAAFMDKEGPLDCPEPTCSSTSPPP